MWATKGKVGMMSDTQIALAIEDQEIRRIISVPHAGIIATALDVGQEETYRRMVIEQRYSMKSFTYSYVNGIPSTEYTQDNSFSVFEFVPGLNITVVADTAKPERWHVHSASGGTIFEIEDYGATLDNGKIHFKAGTPDHLTDTQVRALVEAYEQIRHLERFNADHCPIMEMQLSDKGDIYFLQYHRTRDYESAQSELNPDHFKAEDGWIQAEEVRGELPPQQLALTKVYPQYLPKLGRFLRMPNTDMASANMNNRIVADEVHARQRSLRVDAYGSVNLHSDWAIGHGSRSGWLKAESGIVLPSGALHDAMGEEMSEYINVVVFRARNHMATLAVEAACDGDKGYVRINRSLGTEGVLLTELA